MDFIYDNAGRPYATVNGNSTTAVIYYYILNQQGDVIRIVTAAGATVATYTYNAWGEVISYTGWMAEQNPIRYRGYYFDSESGFYYLGSRYYDPSIGRFINADKISNLAANGDFTSFNLFAYCGNNPVTREDNEGLWWHLAAGAIVGAVSLYVSDVVANVTSGEPLAKAFVPTSSPVDYLAAATSGAIAASGVGAFGSALANAAIDGIAYVANCEIEGEKADADEFLLTIATSAITAGKGIDGANLRGVYKYSTEVLKTAVSPKKIAMYTAKKASVVKTVLTEIGSSLWGAVKDGFSRGLKQRLSL